MPSITDAVRGRGRDQRKSNGRLREYRTPNDVHGDLQSTINVTKMKGQQRNKKGKQGKLPNLLKSTKQPVNKPKTHAKPSAQSGHVDPVLATYKEVKAELKDMRPVNHADPRVAAQKNIENRLLRSNQTHDHKKEPPAEKRCSRQRPPAPKQTALARTHDKNEPITDVIYTNMPLMYWDPRITVRGQSVNTSSKLPPIKPSEPTEDSTRRELVVRMPPIHMDDADDVRNRPGSSATVSKSNANMTCQQPQQRRVTPTEEWIRLSKLTPEPW